MKIPLKKINRDYPDVIVQNEGSIFLVHPRTDLGARWIGENVGQGGMYYGQALVVEHRYIDDLVLGMAEDGLVVK